MKRVMFFSAILVFVCSSLSADGISVPQKYFKTPRACVEYFIDQIKTLNVPGAVASYTIDKKSQGYDFRAYSMRLGALTPFTPPPVEYPFYADLYKMELMGQLSKEIKFFVYSLLRPDYDFTLTHIIQDEKIINDFFNSLNPDKIRSLRIVKIIKPRESLWANEKVINNMKRQAKLFGAEDRTELVVLYSFEGQYFMSGFGFLKYKSKWQIDSLNSSMAGTSMLGNAVPITVQKFEKLAE